MANDAKATKFTLKVMVNRHKTKVLFAEVDSDFADVLLSFLTMPLGKIVRVLKKHYGEDVNIGSLTTLCDGLSNLDSVHFCTNGCKEMLLNPRSTFERDCRKLKLDIHETHSTKYFLCDNLNCGQSRISMYYDTATCICGKTLKREIDVKESEEEAGDGVFTKNTASFLISDDLRMLPNVSVSIIQDLTNLGITDTDGAELMNVTFGFNEIMDLFKGSLLSQTPLTDIILKKRKNIGSTTKEYEAETELRNKIEKEGVVSESDKKMKLKVMVQRSTNKLLFAQARDDFVEFLFGLLTVPLGGVLHCVLGIHSKGLESIYNLYTSLAELIGDRYFFTPDKKTSLMKPLLLGGCKSKNQILPLTEESRHHKLYYNQEGNPNKECTVSYNPGNSYRVLYAKGQKEYIKGTTMFMVSDDLTVKPLSMISTLSKLKEMNIPLSEVRELEVQIGLQEAISILKASLTSTFALTDGLMIDPMSKKKVKQEV
ncbi:hypothetical protein MIMGU_mgv1a018155mg [Erythranthe guttata]|uniref:DUF674 domain-containing protein n=1 Tax=Erythranthe guttata TaxID=4155 RepID=A0A022R5D5_ERYGU|nr:hypothetical protein MIMGU_mgv1a018155mg [Erythranthe guttata]